MIIIILTIALFAAFCLCFILTLHDDDFPGHVTFFTFILLLISFCNIVTKTVKTDVTIAPFKDSTSIIIKYKDEIIIKNDYKLYILDSIKIVYIQEYGFFGNLSNSIKLNECYKN